MGEIHFVDTTLRDGQRSLWALGMKTEAMLAIAEQMEKQALSESPRIRISNGELWRI